MGKRSTAGRALFYTRDSGGKHETTPSEYLRWGQRKASELGVTFNGTPEQIMQVIREGECEKGDLFLDFGVTGNKLSRRGLDAMFRRALADSEVSHVFIPRRDRFARPDDPIDAVKLENALRGAGLTLVFMDRVVPPIRKGHRRDLGEMIKAMLDYNTAGEFRRELAQKILLAQTTLARAGYSVGGRPPYGFRRWLFRADGTQIRQLADGEYVRMADHHVVWLPGPEEELAVIRRILQMLPSIPASRVAAILTREGVPAPDAGRSRTDRGVKHPTSGVWHATSVANIARNPLLLATVTYGRRSMGDQLRFTPDGPRVLAEQDYRNDGQPKVIVNSESSQIIAAAKFDPIVDPTRHEQLLRELERRSGSQRGKPRSRTPEKNPLGARIFDQACGWPLYRQSYPEGFRYLCGLYQQSHGAECEHNHVDGMLATRFMLSCVRQRLLTPSFRIKLEKRLRELAERDRSSVGHDRHIKAKRVALAELRRKRLQVERNLALAETQEQYRAIAGVFDQVSQEERALTLELEQADQSVKPVPDLEADVSTALGDFDRLAQVAADTDNLRSIGELFRHLNARLFLRFKQVKPGKRIINRVAGGVVTFGNSNPPVALYAGPTGRRALEGRGKASPPKVELPSQPSTSFVSDREGESLGNINRGDWI
jgi:DNA invertase Pin-like site-specific DNA recombinase